MQIVILLHAELGTSPPTSLICIASMHVPTLAVIKFEIHCPPHLLVYGSPRIVTLLGGLQCFFMNSDKFKLIFGSDTESEDYIFTGFQAKI